MHKILVINGPNLNLLGDREKKFYGDTTLNKIKSLCEKKCKKYKIECIFFQSNHEGELIDIIHSVNNQFSGIIINPAAYTHTSIAIRDAISAVSLPTIEVHISNTFAREDYRHRSFIAPHAAGVIVGFGLKVYDLALHFFK